ncbi:squalene/phytoene synthase family protein, partial [Candidatus Pacearchaeota archaeon]|nr:squalene/phytoene synthase family protein [Candidatus Pacearchaeota archaeon]
MGLEEMGWPTPPKELFIWPSPDECLDIVKKGGRDLTSDELLAEKSRSFYRPIRILHYANGDDEFDKRFVVTIAYNIMRELDEAEDASNKTLSIEDKVWAIQRFSYVVGDVVRRDPNGKGIEFIINGSDFQTVTQKLIQGASDEYAKVFVEQFGKGIVLKDLYNLGKEQDGKSMKEAIDYCTKSMATGMITFLERGPIETVNQLHNYCYWIAGRIGSGLLNKLLELKDKVKLDDNLAERFGKFLQLINITKNVRSDYTEGRRFFPGELIHGSISYEYMMDGKGLDAQHRRKEVFDNMVKFIEDNVGASINYIKSIPAKKSGYKAFCYFCFLLGQMTLQNMKEAGADRV